MRILARDGIDSLDAFRGGKERDLDLTGAYRPLLNRAIDVEYRLERYDEYVEITVDSYSAASFYLRAQ